MCVLFGEKSTLILACAHFGVYFFSRIRVMLFFVFCASLVGKMTRQRLSMKVKKQIKDLKEKKWKNKDIKHHLGLSKLDNDDVRRACELDYSKASNATGT